MLPHATIAPLRTPAHDFPCSLRRAARAARDARDFRRVDDRPAADRHHRPRHPDRWCSRASGSFARGGAAAGCYVAGLALRGAGARAPDRSLRSAPRAARLRRCCFPRRWCALVAGVSRTSAGLARLRLLAAAAGASFPPITVCMRTYFKRRLKEDALLSTAYSLESVLIEMIFIVGPMLVALFVAVRVASRGGAVRGGAAAASARSLFLRSPALREWRVEAAHGAQPARPARRAGVPRADRRGPVLLDRLRPARRSASLPMPPKPAARRSRASCSD